MNNSDVQIGRVYRYKASTGRKFDVRIESRAPLLRGWRAKDLSTGKPLVIRQAWRLRYELTGESSAPVPIDHKSKAAGE